MYKQKQTLIAMAALSCFSLSACSGDNDPTMIKEEPSAITKTEDKKAEPKLDKKVSIQTEPEHKELDAPLHSEPEEMTPEETRATIEKSLIDIKSDAAISGKITTFFEHNILIYGLSYAPEDIENTNPIGYFIEINDESILDGDGMPDEDAFFSALQSPEGEIWNKENASALLESVINISAESILMSLSPKTQESASDNTSEPNKADNTSS